MRVAITGSTELLWDTAALLKYVTNCTYPHQPDLIITTNEEGTAQSAREMAEEYGIPLFVMGDMYAAIDNCEMSICLRKADEYPYAARYSTEKGRLFKEYVKS